MHTETVMVYFDDLDAMGVVHNGRYATLFERALAAYWALAGWTYDPDHRRFAEVLFVVKEFAITYHVPISRTGAVQVQLWLDHLGTTSVVYGFRVVSDDGTVIHAKGRRVQVRLDPATLRPAPLSAELRNACLLESPARSRAQESALNVVRFGVQGQPGGDEPGIAQFGVLRCGRFDRSHAGIESASAGGAVRLSRKLWLRAAALADRRASCAVFAQACGGPAGEESEGIA